MITLIKRGKVYHARVNAEGKTTTITTRETDRTKARQALKDSGLENLHAAAKTHRLTNEGVTRILSGRKVTLEQAVDEWAEWMKSIRNSPRTVENSSASVRRFLADRGLAKDAPAGITLKAINAWLEGMEGTKYNTRRIALSPLSSFCEFCSAKGWSAGNPARLARIDADALTHEEKETKVREVFTQHEINRLLAGAEGFWKFAIRLSFETGLRLEDVACLEWASFETEGVVIVHTRKSDKRVALPISHELQVMLTEIPLLDGRYLFPEERQIQMSLTRRALLSTQFNRLCRRLSLKEGKSFHCLRHTRVTLWNKELRASGLTHEECMVKIGKMVGHTHTKTTEGYVH